MDDSPKGRILRAASHLFITRGYASTSVRELAAAVGIQSGSLFHHFDTKADILETVMVEVIGLNTERMREAMIASPTPLQRLRALVTCELTSIHGETSEAMSLLNAEWRTLEEKARARVLVLRDAYEQLWVDTIAACSGDVVSMKPALMRRLILGMIAQSGYWFDREGTMGLDDLTDAIMSLVLVKERN